MSSFGFPWNYIRSNVTHSRIYSKLMLRGKLCELFQIDGRDFLCDCDFFTFSHIWYILYYAVYYTILRKYSDYRKIDIWAFLQNIHFGPPPSQKNYVMYVRDQLYRPNHLPYLKKKFTKHEFWDNMYARMILKSTPISENTQKFV